MTQTPQDWMDAFAKAISAQDIPAITALFHETCYWRDLLTFTWNIKTMEGRPAIAAMLAETLPRTAPTGWRLTEPPEADGDQTHAWPVKTVRQKPFERPGQQRLGRDPEPVDEVQRQPDRQDREQPLQQYPADAFHIETHIVKYTDQVLRISGHRSRETVHE